MNFLQHALIVTILTAMVVSQTHACSKRKVDSVTECYREGVISSLAEAINGNDIKSCVLATKAYRCYANLSASCIRYFRSKVGDGIDAAVIASRLSDSQIAQNCADKK